MNNDTPQPNQKNNNNNTNKRRFIVKKHKDTLSKGLTEILQKYPEAAHIFRLFALKLLKDHSSVSSKRGTKNFDKERWIKSNVTPKQ